MEEFEAEVGMEWEQAVAQAEKAHAEEAPLSDRSALASKFVFMDGGKREGFDMGQWWSQGGPRDEVRPEMTEVDWALLRHGFVWHQDVFSIAAKAVDYLGLFAYMALHARYGDFAEHQSQRSPDQIYENWRPLIANASAMYVATDRQGQFDGFAERHGVKLVMWPDLFTAATGGVLSAEKQLYTPERFFKLMGPVEEVICTFAKVFVGTDRSSFTGHIQRMRIHADAPVIQRLTHTDGNPFTHTSREMQVPLDDIQKSIQQWEQRGWTDPDITKGEQFKQKTTKLLRNVSRLF
jgi:hypothetical protein